MVQMFLESINHVFTVLAGLFVYWFIWVVPAISIGRELVAKAGHRDWLANTIGTLIFIVFSFPTILAIVLYLRH